MPSENTSHDESSDILDSSPEQLYFLAIEKVFVELRGSPLYLSPKDWKIARGWYDGGIPIEWVERTLREIFEKRRAKGTDDKILNLGYCRRSVAAAWKRRQALETPEVEAEAIDVPARLASLARALPSSLAERDVAVRRLEALEGDPETVEIRLAEVDRDILEVAKEGLSDEDRQEVATDLTKALDRLRSRLPSEELERAAARLEERLVRERLALPVLSLFAPEALTNETSEAVTEPAA